MPDALTLQPIDPEIITRGDATIALGPDVDRYVQGLVDAGLRNV